MWTNSDAPSSWVAFSPDEKLIAAGRTKSIDLLDTATGVVIKNIWRPEGKNPRIVFSPDGQWLAWAQNDDHIWLLDYRDEHATPVKVLAKGVGEFAVVAGGKSIVAVIGTSALSGYTLDQQPDGSWKPTKIEISDCMIPQSVSAGSKYTSATWRAQECIYQATNSDRKEFSRHNTDEARDRTIFDVVWSAGGASFAQLLTSRDIIVGTDNQLRLHGESRIKGASMDVRAGESLRISVSEGGTRMALIEGRGLVRVYSLAEHKPFLSRLDKVSSVAPDGTWMAVARPATPGKAGAMIDVIPIDRSFPPDYRAEVRKSIPVDGLPTRIYATQSSVVADLASTAVVFDAATGKPRFNPLVGRARLLGDTMELLLISPSSPTQPLRLIKTKDGSELARWDQLPAAGGEPVFRVSRSNKALAIRRVQASNPKQADAFVYSVRGEHMVQTGQVLDLPVSAFNRLEVSDDARSLTETRPAQSGKPPLQLIWSVTNTRDPARSKPTPPARAIGCIQDEPPGPIRNSAAVRKKRWCRNV